jgi:uncharacterized protein (TIGR04168 family)
VAVFVGDFGEESIGLIRRVASVPMPKAVILGNHDAWYACVGQYSRPPTFHHKTEWSSMKCDNQGRHV